MCRLIAEENAENLGIIEKMDESECEFNAKDSIFITPINQTEESTKRIKILLLNSMKKKLIILSNLENVMKWENPSRIQMAAVDILLKVKFLL